MLAIFTRHHLHLIWRKEDIGNIELLQRARVDGFAFFEYAVDDWHGGIQKLLVFVGGDDADDGERVLQWACEHRSEEVDRMRENVGIIADEYDLVLQHQQSPQI